MTVPRIDMGMEALQSILDRANKPLLWFYKTAPMAGVAVIILITALGLHWGVDLHPEGPWYQEVLVHLMVFHVMGTWAFMILWSIIWGRRLAYRYLSRLWRSLDHT